MGNEAVGGDYYSEGEGEGVGVGVAGIELMKAMTLEQSRDVRSESGSEK